MKFEMSETETERARAWIKAQIKKTDGKVTKDATGFRFGYIFYPTSLGMTVKVVDSNLNEAKDVSDEI